MEMIAKRIAELTQKLNELNRKYYLEDTSEVSDFEFDAMMAELESLEIQNPELRREDSPTLRVGGGLLEGFQTFRHRYPMLSLANTYDRGELLEFDNRIAKTIPQHRQYVCELKFDGLAISLCYEKGKLIRALTRGDGEQGDDVTQNIKTIASIPLKVDVDFDFEVRGEVFFTKKRFAELNEQIDKENQKRGIEGKSLLKTLANPRNAASGTIKMLDTKAVAKRKLQCFVYGLLGENLSFKSHSQSLVWLSDMGFPVSDTWKKCSSIDEVIGFIDKWETDREHFQVETDGIVVKLDSFEQQSILGFTSKSPRWATAFKYKAQTALTKLDSVDFQVGRTGAVTPVANLRPVLLAGTTVKRATLHNANEIERLNLHENDWVLLEKGGEIIPKITAVDVSKRSKDAAPLAFPNFCPKCGTPLERPDHEVAFYCPNRKTCPPQQIGKIEHFVHRKAMNIESLGAETIATLFEKRLINSISDLYDLKREDLLLLDRFAEKSVDKLLEGIEASKSVPFSRVLFALGIRFVGESVAEKLAQHFNSIEAIQTATLQELCEVPEIGEKIAQSLVDFFQDPENLKILEKLKSKGIKFETSKEDLNSLLSEKLSGLTFVVTGTFDTMSREEMEQLVILHSGKLVSSVSSKLSFLIAGNKPGAAKLEKAQKLNLKILSETEFLQMLN
jgi:DNA ligase (NAD+)